jgi:two-component system response regulator HydG
MNAIQRALVVDDDEDVLRLCQVALQTEASCTVAVARSAEAALGAARREHPDVILLDVIMPGGGGFTVLDRLKGCDATAAIPVVLMTGAGAAVIDACRDRGAAGVIAKPFDPIALPAEIGQILADLDSSTMLAPLADARANAVDEILGDSPAMTRTRDICARAAASDASVLVTGESGTGKELVARALHRASRRAGGPFVALNCAAVPESLLESELFGHVRGAFTDAKVARRGLFSEADGGTLFLDEIGELSPRLQPKLLRALQERTARPVGGTAEIPFDVRLVAATNEDLHTAVAERRFRSDLFFRLNVVPIEVPPLRARGDDIALLARRFATLYAARHGKRVTGLSPEALDLLQAYPWPGNVRELQNAVERAVALGDGEIIGPDDLPEHIRGSAARLALAGSRALSEHGHAPLALPEAGAASASLLPLAEVERRHVLHVLAAVDGNKRLAARILGLDRRTLYRRLDQYQGRG